MADLDKDPFSMTVQAEFQASDANSPRLASLVKGIVGAFLMSALIAATVMWSADANQAVAANSDFNNLPTVTALAAFATLFLPAATIWFFIWRATWIDRQHG